MSSYLFVEMLWHLLAALILGAALGWMIWGWRSRAPQAAMADPGARRELADRDATRSELARLRSALTSADQRRREAEAQAAAFSAELRMARDGGAASASAPASGAAEQAQVATLQARVAELEAALAAQRGAETGASGTTPGSTAPASLGDELERVQRRAANAERGLRELRRVAAGAKKAIAEKAALEARLDQLKDDLSDTRHRAEESMTAEASREEARAELEAAKAEIARQESARETLVADLENAQARAANAETELARLRAAASEADAEVGAAAPAQPLAAAPGDDSAESAGQGEVEDEGAPDPDAVGDRPALLEEARDGAPDDLKRIKGVGAKIEEILHDLGVYHFDQIAAWTERETAWVDARLRFRGRISRDDWVGQAKTLAAGGETEFSKKVDKGGVYD